MRNNKDFYKQCQGCRSYSQMVRKPNCSVRRIPYIPKGSVCPCSICLVKGMCNRLCSEFQDFIYFLKGVELDVCRGDDND